MATFRLLAQPLILLVSIPFAATDAIGLALLHLFRGQLLWQAELRVGVFPDLQQHWDACATMVSLTWPLP